MTKAAIEGRVGIDCAGEAVPQAGMAVRGQAWQLQGERGQVLSEPAQ